MNEESGVRNFLAGGGETGKIIRSKNWEATPVGRPENWPPELRTAVRLMLTTNHPIFIFWGEELTCFYNDAYSQSIGPERHPQAIGKPAREVWEEIWDIIGPQIELVMKGEGATWHQDHLVPITRHGVREDVYWTYSYSPIDNPAAPHGVGGVLVICTETTQRIRIEQELEKELAAKEILLREVNHRIKNSLQIVATLLRMESRAADSEDTQNSLQRASARVHAVSSVHELIYRSEGIATVEIKDYVTELCKSIEETLGYLANIQLVCKAEPVEIPTDLAISMALLINELVTNACKYAFPDDRRGTVEVSVSREDHGLRILVSDDGVGKADDAREGLGSRIIAGLTAQLDGELKEASDDGGHSVVLNLPLPE